MTKQELAARMQEHQAWVPGKRVKLDFGGDGVILLDGAASQVSEDDGAADREQAVGRVRDDPGEAAARHLAHAADLPRLARAADEVSQARDRVCRDPLPARPGGPMSLPISSKRPLANAWAPYGSRLTASMTYARRRRQIRFDAGMTTVCSSHRLHRVNLRLTD